MKKIVGLFALLFLLNGCNDGKLDVNNINFDNVQAASCNQTIYKINGNDIIFMQIPADQNAFLNDITLLNTPRVVTIGGTVSVTYRSYNGPPTGASICNTPSPITPTATEEWVATSGNIEITTTAVYSAPNSTTGATKIAKYVHHIVFRNLVFAKPNGQQVYDTYIFGDYSTVPTTLPLSFDVANIKLCPNTNLLFNARENGIEGMFIQNFDTSLLSTANLGVVKTGLISSTTNKLVYRLFQSALLNMSTSDYFCATSTPSSPAITDEWVGQDGVANVSGIIEVTTTTNGTGFLHSIHLKGVTFQKGNSTFYYGNDIELGELLTAN